MRRNNFDIARTAYLMIVSRITFLKMFRDNPKMVRRYNKVLTRLSKKCAQRSKNRDSIIKTLFKYLSRGQYE